MTKSVGAASVCSRPLVRTTCAPYFCLLRETRCAVPEAVGRLARIGPDQRGLLSLFGGPRRDHHEQVDLTDAKAPEEATPGHVAAERPVRHHRVRTALLILLSLVIVFIVVSVVLTLEGRARPVSIGQAISRYHSAASIRSGHPPASGCVLVPGLGHRQPEPPAPLPGRGADTPRNRRGPEGRVLVLPHRLLHQPLAELDLLRASHRPGGDGRIGVAALDGRSRGRDQLVDVAVYPGVGQHPCGAGRGQVLGRRDARARRPRYAAPW